MFEGDLYTVVVCVCVCVCVFCVSVRVRVRVRACVYREKEKQTNQCTIARCCQGGDGGGTVGLCGKDVAALRAGGGEVRRN